MNCCLARPAARQGFQHALDCLHGGDVFRILTRGGIFLYPGDTKDPSKPGRRLMYGSQSDGVHYRASRWRGNHGRERLLRRDATALHQRVPVMLGSSTRWKWWWGITSRPRSIRRAARHSFTLHFPESHLVPFCHCHSCWVLMSVASQPSPLHAKDGQVRPHRAHWPRCCATTRLSTARKIPIASSFEGDAAALAKLRRHPEDDARRKKALEQFRAPSPRCPPKT